MNYRLSTASRAATALVALAAWLGLAIQFYVTQTHPNLQDVSVFERSVRFFEYFTIFTNLLVAVSLTVPLLTPAKGIGRLFSGASVKTAVAVYIALVGIVYNVVLQGLHDFSGAAFVADLLTHDVVPLIYVIYWLILVPKGEVTWTMPLMWLVYPLVYLPYVLIRGSFTSRYPYPFLNVSDLGLPAVLVNTVVLTIVFLLLGELFVAADKIIARLRPGAKES